jgi:aminomethyltransferase
VGVEIDGDPFDLNRTAWPVSRDGKPVGRVTSAVFSPRLKKNIGYAMVPADEAALGTSLTVRIPEIGERRATIVTIPFVDPRKEIPKS